MSTFYTRGGDEGLTGLLGEGRVSKFDVRMETLGSLDETSAALGLARCTCLTAEIGPILLRVQRELYAIMAECAATEETAQRFRTISSSSVEWLEQQTDRISAQVEIPRDFIIPGDSLGGAFLDQARTIARRAERRVVELHARGNLQNPEILKYMNRLSSLIFVLEIMENQASGSENSTLAKIKK